MNIVQCERRHLVERCQQRGADIEEAMKSVTFSSGDRLYVDTDHPSYPKRPKGLGDYVATGLSAVGITPEKVSKVIGKPCGCNKRKERLNKLGKKFGIGADPADIKDNRKGN